MAEWSIATVLKTVGGASHPRVRISAFPPTKRHPERVFFFVGKKEFGSNLRVEEFDDERKADFKTPVGFKAQNTFEKVFFVVLACMIFF